MKEVPRLALLFHLLAPWRGLRAPTFTITITAIARRNHLEL
jgi:hypothetical protein